MSQPEVQVYTVRPDLTPLWLPEHLAQRLGIRYGDHLAPEQFNSREIQDLIKLRLELEKKKKKAHAEDPVRTEACNGFRSLKEQLSGLSASEVNALPSCDSRKQLPAP